MYRYGLLNLAVVGVVQRPPFVCTTFSSTLGFHGLVVVDGHAHIETPLLKAVERVSPTTSVFKIEHWSRFAVLKGSDVNVGLRAYRFECQTTDQLVAGVCALTHQRCATSNLYLVAGIAPLRLLLVPR